MQRSFLHYIVFGMNISSSIEPWWQWRSQKVQLSCPDPHWAWRDFPSPFIFVCTCFLIVNRAKEKCFNVLPGTLNNSLNSGRSLLFQVIIPCSWLFGLVINFPGFLVKNFDAKAAFCIRRYPEEWMAKTYTLIWFLLLAFFPVVIMAALYSRVVHTLWFHRPQHHAFDNRQQVRLEEGKVLDCFKSGWGKGTYPHASWYYFKLRVMLWKLFWCRAHGRTACN